MSEDNIDQETTDAVRVILEGLSEEASADGARVSVAEFDEKTYREALKRVPELAGIFAAAAAGKLTRREAREQMQPHLQKFLEEYDRLMRSE